MRVIKQAILATSLLAFLAVAGSAFDEQKKPPPKGKPPVVTPQPKGPPQEGKKPKKPNNFQF